MNNAPASATILVVDDEPVVLDSLRMTLEREHYHVIACSNPQKALTVLEERDVAVIISDQKMPEMPGHEFLIRSRSLRPQASPLTRRTTSPIRCP